MPTLLDSPPHLPIIPLLEENQQDVFDAAMEEMENTGHQDGHLDGVKIQMLSSPVGPLLVGVNDQSIRFLHFGQIERLAEQLTRLQQHINKPLRNAVHSLHKQLEAELNEYFKQQRKIFTLPLKPMGTAFQLRVWQALQHIPYGQTWSYEQLANEIGQPTASRAVGMANGANPIAILIPCHRVVNKNGQIGGYGGGIWRKQILLDLEKPV